LKHKRATRGASRIVLFIGSPLENVDERQLTQIGKKMKKNQVAVDIVSFGEINENESKLNALMEAVNNQNNSHMVSIPPGLSPSDVIISSPIIYGDTGGQGDIGGETTSSNTGGGGGDFGGLGGGDMDFEQQLQMAMRQSYEEERARVERERKEKEGNDGGEGEQMEGIPEEGGFDDLDEEEMMRKAMELSMEEENNNNNDNSQENTTSSNGMDIEETNNVEPQGSTTDAPPTEDVAPEFLDEEFVQSMLADFQVDPNHPAILDALASVRGEGTNSESKDESENKDKEEEKK